ncbi:transmembrane and TPR repeat-containing protein [Striga asiatica]|uniref:Transmembrane and TPR repeat-containing protein n=1 Tax=Striga asiatica TaxID=4170 RepID=A0A5A7Q1X7_STRAF|nr:transmembrane and TPR repeat-containing protein [Striga asiatica]
MGFATASEARPNSAYNKGKASIVEHQWSHLKDSKVAFGAGDIQAWLRFFENLNSSYLYVFKYVFEILNGTPQKEPPRINEKIAADEEALEENYKCAETSRYTFLLGLG